MNGAPKNLCGIDWKARPSNRTLTPAEAYAIRRMRNRYKMKIREIHETTGVSTAAIMRVFSGTSAVSREVALYRAPLRTGTASARRGGAS